MNRVVFLLEELSMRLFLEGLLPRLFADLDLKTTCLFLVHEGKQDLLNSARRKLLAFREPGVRFVLLIDNDRDDCIRKKNELITLCRESKRPDTLVRLACQELEAWYFGDPAAMAIAFDAPRLAEIGQRRKFRDPDLIARPSEELKILVPHFQKLSGARAMADHVDERRSTSRSFRVFVAGLRSILARVDRP